jgi:hypothetical protein
MADNNMAIFVFACHGGEFMFRARESIRCRRAVALLLLAVLTAPSAWAATNWGDDPANLTISEYLNLQFKLYMQQPDTAALNSYSIVNFYPAWNPQSAVVVVMQTWHDERARPQDLQDLRREIRKVGEALSAEFASMAGLPSIKGRWPSANPRANFIVKHVRYSDNQETLGVTIGGETIFDQDGISKAKLEVLGRGGVWSW